ncbi:MAG: FkbM family methyltransferase, partial [Bdellovibrionales bacterium]|nr:FkbM family methyltransferase [Bdellovibrionales bacterium]
MKKKYHTVQPLRPEDGYRHISRMRFLTKWLSPIFRTRGLNFVANLYANRLTTQPLSVVKLNPSSSFCFPTFDSYWGYYIYNKKTYEKSLEELLLQFKDIPYTFLDCGANFGYWSALVSSPQLGSHKVIAVEASLETYKILNHTYLQNHKRFTHLYRAISNTDGKVLKFTAGGRHAGRHIVDGTIEKLKVNDSYFESNDLNNDVESITLDSLAKNFSTEENSFIVKLDVEGAEIDAFEGATSLSQKDTIFIYEDYGGDRQSMVSNKLLKDGYEVYYPTDEGNVERIHDVRRIDTIKKNIRLGYNFIALKGKGPLTDKVRQLQNKKIKILHMTAGLDTGGTEMMICKVTSLMDKERFANSVLCFKPPGNLSAKLSEKDINFFSLNIKHPVQFFTKLFRFRRLLKEINPDVIQGWLVHGNMAALAAKLLLPKVEVYWNIRHTLVGIEKEKLHTRFLIFASKSLSRFSKKIVYNSHTSKLQHFDYGYRKSPGLLIPNGFDTETFRPNTAARQKILDELCLPSDTNLIGIIARYHPVKGHHVFLEAAKLLLDKGCKAHFVLVGSNISLKNPKISKIMSESPHLSNFSFMGERTDIPDIIAALDIATLSSSWGEAFPNVLGEAMSSGVICVATDVGDCHRIVGDSGIVVPPDQPAKLAEAWKHVLDLPKTQKDLLKENSRKRVLDLFSIESVIKSYEDLYSTKTRH